MSSYDPLDESDEEAKRDSGVKRNDVVDERQLLDIVGELDRADYVKIGVLLALPAGLLTVLLVGGFVPGWQDTAGELVRALLDAIPGDSGPD